MSICNVYLDGDRALLAVDTAGRDLAGKPGEWSKLEIVPHAGVALGFRGERVLCFQVLAQVHMVPGGESFDALEASMGARLKWALDAFRANVKPALVAASECEVMLVGWSAKRGRMAAVGFYLAAGGKGFERSEVQHCRLAPNVKDPPVPTDGAEMQAVARLQVAEIRSRSDAPIGGRLLVAEIWPGRVELSYRGNI
ncbi:hypothetical protein GCM10008101_06850 [Lysobacter xinjiangensis]|uniref:Uncharacterized protein n=1 Tax=Cognatilysobacter xinjiangensis TaxID=546892 RepID=A0ABQ3BSH3_9GAMM|nr:hypothetical protein [Lysobacter xinjiangensis]GGZ56069.1 hypothetical protein GCM10008101_06850 [Lysobacter xinjiangensis]